MVEKFNPAPLDKHPEDPKEAAKADREMDGNFMAGLVGTFPASDPVSGAPSPTTIPPLRFRGARGCPPVAASTPVPHRPCCRAIKTRATKRSIAFLVAEAR